MLVGLGILAPLYQAATDASDKTEDLQTRLSVVNQKIGVRQSALTRRSDMESTIQSYQAILEQRERLIADLEAVDGLAREVGVLVSGVAHTGDKVTIEYGADSSADFDAYYDALTKKDPVTEKEPPFLPGTRPPKTFPFPRSGSIQVLTGR